MNETIRAILEQVRTGQLDKAQAMAALRAGLHERTPDAPPPFDRKATIRRLVLDAIAAQLELPPEKVDPDQSFSDLGTDSVAAARMLSAVGASLGVDLPITILFDFGSVNKLVDYVDEHHGHRIASMPAAPVPAAEPQPAPVAHVRGAPERAADDDDIAVVGMAGRFPRAANLDQFWHNLANGVDCISEVPPDRWRVEDYFDPVPGTPNKTYSKWAGLLDNVDGFDPLFFKLSPKEAEFMEPQQRLFMTEAFKAIEDAGFSAAELAERLCGVFATCGQSEYNSRVSWQDGMQVRGEKLGTHDFIGNHDAILSARLSYCLDLKGPCVAVDTACSSSLMTVHLACQSIRQGECDIALAGGVSLNLLPLFHVFASQAGMLSPDGRCKPFDNAANGFVPGEGVAVVVLQRLSDAIRDGAHIYGVIKGSGTNYDGRTNGITAPSGKSQAALISQVYRRYGIDASTISYVEAHGTGTKLGDPVELSGLTQAFREYTDARGYCALGSVKSNIGHPIYAAGIASLVKVLLSLKHGKLTPTLHFRQANDRIDLDASPFFVTRTLQDWSPVGGQRRAAISSFGFSGTNCHVVVAEAPPQDVPREEGLPYHLVVLSAKTAPQLQRRVDDLRDWLDRPGDTFRLTDLAFTLAVGRDHYQYRAAFVVESREQLRAALERHAPAPARAAAAAPVPAAVLQDLRAAKADGGPAFRCHLDALAEHYIGGGEIAWQEVYQALQPLAARRIALPAYPFANRKFWYSAPDDGGARALPAPARHPWIAERKIDRAVARFTGSDALLADHRIGERPLLPGVAYLELARAALQGMSGRTPVVLRDIRWLRPFACVGDGTQALDTIVELGEGNAVFRCVGTQGVHAQGAFGPEAGPEEGAALDIAAILGRCQARQIDHDEIYRRYRDKGIEYRGYFQSLQSAGGAAGDEAIALIRLTDTALLPGVVLHPGIMDCALQSVIGLQLPEGEHEKHVYVPYALERLAVHAPLEPACYAYVKYVGNKQQAELTVDIVIADLQGRPLVTLRGYALRRLAATQPQPRPHSAPAGDDDVLLCEFAWKRQPVEPMQSGEEPSRPRLLAFTDNEGLVGELRARGADPVRVVAAATFSRVSATCFGVNPFDMDSFVTLLDHAGGFDGVIFDWSRLDAPSGPDRTAPARLEEACGSLLALCNFSAACLRRVPRASVRLLSIGPADRGGAQPASAAAGGLARSIRYENTKFQYKTVALEESIVRHPVTLAGVVLAELRNNPKDHEVVYRDGERWVRALRETRAARGGPAMRERGVYWISGGMGGIGLDVARYLARQYRARLVLTGRSPETDAHRQSLRELADLGGEAIYLVADVADAAAVRQAHAHVRQRFGQLHGILHCAGVLEDNLLRNKSSQSMMGVLAPKVLGVLNLDEVTKDEALDHFIVFSSVAMLGNQGQADYASANCFLDAFVQRRDAWRRLGQRHGRSASINWPIWREGGMRPSSDMENLLREMFGMRLLETDTAMRVLEQAVASDLEQMVVLYGDRDKIMRQFGVEQYRLKAAPMTTETALPQGPDAVAVEAVIKGLMSELLSVSSDELDLDSDITEYGTDSILLAELVARINRRYGDILNPAALADLSTIRHFVDHVVRHAPPEAVPAAHAAPAAPLPSTRAAAAGRTEAIAERIKHHCAQLLDIPVDHFDIDADFGDYGTDSIVLASLVSRLNEEYGDVLNPADLPQLTTIAALARHIAASLPAVADIPVATHEPAGVREAETASATRAAPAPDQGEGQAIAVVGMGGVFPGCTDLDGFWDVIRTGRCTVGPVPASRWNADDYLSSDRGAVDKSYVMAGGFLDDVAGFDPDFFGIAQDAVDVLDPQQRIFLEVAYRAVEDAGYDRGALSGRKCAVYVGARQSQYVSVNATAVNNHPRGLTGNMPNLVAARVAHFFDLKGPALTIDTACSSSLVALHLACQSLRHGESELAIVGGIELLLSPSNFITASKSRILSPSGRCYAFDRRADGLVLGEGAGAVMLKPLERAVADGDHVYAVIRGSSSNNDGLSQDMIPNLDAQKEVMRSCYRSLAGGIADLDYIELHGAGTTFGDAYELRALKELAEEQGAIQGPDPIGFGSVKANIGHLNAAAGIASVIKACQVLDRRCIPPIAESLRLNPLYGLADTRFTLHQAAQAWRPDHAARPMRVAVNSLGFGGTNCHVLFESRDNPRARPAVARAPMNKRPYWLVPGRAADVPSAPPMAVAPAVSREQAALTREAGADRVRAAREELTRICVELLHKSGIDKAASADAIAGSASLFELGLGSVELMDLFTRIGQRMGVALNPSLLVENRSIDDFARTIAAALENDGGACARSLCVQDAHTAHALPPAAAAPAPVRDDSAQAGAREMDFSLFFFADYALDGGAYRLLVDSAKFADERGFHAIYTPERHFAEFGGIYANPAVTSAALATITRNVRLRAGSVVMPLHDPLRIAEEWAMVDNLSGGRVDLSFTAGWQCDDFVLHPERYEQRHQYMFDNLEQIRRLWRGDSIVRKNGLGKEIDVRIYPKPVQPECPLWITTAGAQETFVSAGRLGANVITFLLAHNTSIPALAEKIALYRRTRAEHGFDPDTGKVAVMLHTFVGPDMPTVRETVREPLFRYFRSSINLTKNLMRSIDPSLQVEDTAQFDMMFPLAFERIVNSAGLLGTVDSCKAMVDRLADAGVNEVACLIDFGVGHENVMQGLAHLDRLRRCYAPTRMAGAPAAPVAAVTRAATPRAQTGSSEAFLAASYRVKRHIPGMSQDAQPEPARAPAPGPDVAGGGRRVHKHLDIAVVGMSCRFPGCDGLAGYERAIRSGAVLQHAPRVDWQALAGSAPQSGMPEVAGVSALVREALHAAGHGRAGGLPADAAMFLGARNALLEAGALQDFPSRLAHELELGEPVRIIDTHCTSSSIALHEACGYLRDHPDTLVIVGGIEFDVPEDALRAAMDARVISPSGTLRAFDRLGDGAVFREGGGVVILKSLARAVRDGNTVHAVIHSSAVNEDNGSFNPAEKVRRQKQLLDLVYRDNRIAFPDLHYVECHGIGNAFADGLELQALSEYAAETGAQAGSPRPQLAVGSVKANIGHLNPAAGIAGFIKCVLLLSQGYRPPLANHVDEPAYPGLADSALTVGNALSMLDPGKDSWWAALHAYDFGGTLNHHMLLCLPIDYRTRCLREPAPDAPAADVSATEASATEASFAAELAGMAAAILKVEPGDLDIDTDLGDTNFDSVGFTAFADAVGARYGIPLSPSLFFQFKTIRAFAGYLADQYRAAVASLPASARVRAGGPSADEEPIAVVGMSGVFPRSADLAGFWQHLVAGDSLVTEVPDDRWFKPVLDHHAAQGGPVTISRWGGFLDDVASFDPEFFGITPREAEWMDPQQRIMMQLAWHAIEDAGVDPHGTRGSATGLFVGAQYQDYCDEMIRRQQADVLMITGNVRNMLCNRISYFMDWHGPSEMVETACSASLVAVHRAVRAIRAGECEQALAGGVSLLLSPNSFVLPSLAGMMSPDGRCHTFDTRANGFVKGEGAGVVFLKPLSRAQADGDTIYGVIRGAATNHGGKSQSLTAPNPAAQARVVESALHDAGVDAASIAYVETHGTGTKLGDPVELEGLKLAFGGQRTQPWCGVGSVKPNIGHLEPAAGIASFIKVMLALEHRYLPATIGVEQVNPYLQLEASPFRIQAQAGEWEALRDAQGRALPLRAGISSFGFGGSNAHVVVEEAPPAAAPVRAHSGAACIFALSARNEAALRDYARAILAFVDANMPQADAAAQAEWVKDLAYTYAGGRPAFACRLAYVFTDAQQFVASLRRYVERQVDGAVYEGQAFAAEGNERAGEAERAYTRALLQEGRAGQVARQWVAGFPVDWRALWSGPRRKPHGLPAYPFQKKRFWLDFIRADDAPAATEPSAPAVPASVPVPASNLPVAADVGTIDRCDEHLIRVLRDVTGHGADAITPATSLEADIGLDSIKVMQLIARLGEHLPESEQAHFMGELTPQRLLSAQTVGDLAALLAGMPGYRPQPAAAPGAPSAEPSGSSGRIDLLNSQYYILLSHLGSNSQQCSTVRLEGVFDDERAHAAWQALTDHHLLLRSRIVATPPATRMRAFAVEVLDAVAVPPVEVTDLSHLDAAAQEAALRDAVTVALHRECRLDRWPLLHVYAFRLAADVHQLFFETTHLVADGLSMQQIVRDFLDAYADGKPARAAAASNDVEQYRALVARMNDWHDAAAAAQLRQYARTHGLRTFRWNPEGRPAGGVKARLMTFRHRLSAATTAALLAATSRWRLPVNSLLVAAYLRALHALGAGMDEPITLSLPTSGRVYPDCDASGVVGCFAQSVVLSFQSPASGESWEALLTRVHEEIRHALLVGYDRLQMREIGELCRDRVPLVDGKLDPAMLANMGNVAQKTNQYFSNIGAVDLAERYGPLAVTDYTAFTTNAADAIDNLVEIFHGRLQFTANYDSEFYSEDTIAALMRQMQAQIEALLCATPQPDSARRPDAPAAGEGVMSTLRRLFKDVASKDLPDDACGRDLEADLGIDSLTQMRYVMAVRKQYGDADPARLLACRTLSEMAVLLAPGRRADPATPIDAIVAQAHATPDAAAIIEGDSILTYAQLHLATNRLASLLARRGVGAGVRVGVLGDRTGALVMGILAILKAGGTYVPLDPAYPDERLRYIAAHAGISILVSDAALLPKIGATFGADSALAQIVVTGRSDQASIAGVPVADADAWAGEPDADLPPADPSALMAVLYTSGSTGVPKGVQLTHAGYQNRLAWHQRHFQLQPGERVAQKTSCCFDISVWEIFWPLMMGGVLCPVASDICRNPWRLASFLRGNRIGVAHFVPSMFAEFLAAMEDEDWSFPSLRQIVFSGEALPWSLLEKWRREQGLTTRLTNLYGPTEASIDVTVFDANGPAGEGTVPIGAAIDNVALHVLGEDDMPVAPGAEGQLWIGGIQLSTGYLDNEERTARAFRTWPEYGRLYATGDLVRRTEDGVYHYLGRIDDQMKVRGFRVEPGEIESVLTRGEEIQEACVCGVPAAAPQRLVAFLKGRRLDDAALRLRLRETLPPYMMPSEFLWIDAMPKTPNGKLDRAALRRLLDARDRGMERDTDDEQRLPVGPGQYWLLHYFDAPYRWSGHTRVRYRNALDVEALNRLLRQCAGEEPTLRTVFARDDEGRWMQRILPASAAATFAVDFHDLSALEEGMREAHMQSLRTALHESLDMTRPFLWRVLVVKLGESLFDLTFISHHLICDMVSASILLGRLAEYGRAPVDAELSSARARKTYVDYVQALEPYRNADAIAPVASYWNTMLSRPRSALVPDFELGENIECSSARMTFALSAQETAQLLGQTKGHFNSTLYPVLLAPIYATFADLCATSWVVLAHRVHGRAVGNTVFAEAMGNFAVNYPLGVEIVRERNWKDTVRAIQAALDGMPLNGIGYDLAAEHLAPECYPDNRVTPVRVNYLGNRTLPALHDWEVVAADRDPRVAPPGQKRISLIEYFLSVEDGILKVDIDYSRHFYAPETIRLLGRKFLAMMGELLDETAAAHGARDTAEREAVKV